MYSQAKVQILIFFCHHKPVTAWKKLSLRLRFTALSRGIALFIVCWDTCWFCSKADFDFGNWSSSSLTPALHTRGLKESWDNHNPFFQWVWSLSTASNTVWITKGLPVFRGKLDGKLLLREKTSGLKEHRFLTPCGVQHGATAMSVWQREKRPSRYMGESVRPNISPHLCVLVCCVGTLGGVEPGKCTLHFDFEEVFRKMRAYCIQLAAFVVSGIAMVLFYCSWSDEVWQMDGASVILK